MIIKIDTSKLENEFYTGNKLRKEIADFIDELAKIFSREFHADYETYLPDEVYFKYWLSGEYELRREKEFKFTKTEKSRADLMKFAKLLMDDWLDRVAENIQVENEFIDSAISRLRASNSDSLED